MGVEEVVVEVVVAAWNVGVPLEVEAFESGVEVQVAAVAKGSLRSKETDHDY